MSNQELFSILLSGVFVLAIVLFILIIRNILQHQKIYSFRTNDPLWKHWKSQFYGLILFIFGFVSFVFLIFIYALLTHPEFFGFGLNLIFLFKDPFQNPIYTIFTYIGLIIAIIGMILSTQAMKNFINNIKKSKGEQA